MRILAGFAVLLTSAVSVSLAADQPVHEALNSTLWAQHAAEHHGACLQAYVQARQQLDRARKKRDWTAAVEQTGDFKRLPPAIVFDIDETVLDNSPEQAPAVAAGADFDPIRWRKWVEEAQAQPIPGAVAFTQYATDKGVKVFFVTNRTAEEEPATRRNLERAGFTLGTGEDAVLCRNERPDWTSDKSSRRRAIAAKHRVLLLVGDDLGDFLGNVRTTLARRKELAGPYETYWGERWIVLPNAMYGSWEAALYDSQTPLSRAEKLAIKYRSLDQAEASAAAGGR